MNEIVSFVGIGSRLNALVAFVSPSQPGLHDTYDKTKGLFNFTARTAGTN